MSTPEDMKAFLQKYGTKFVSYEALDKFSAEIVDVIDLTVDGPRVKSRFEALERELAEMRSEHAVWKTQPFLKDAGIWRHGMIFASGDVAQFKGTRWVCTKAHIASGTPDHASFQLWTKTDVR